MSGSSYLPTGDPSANRNRRPVSAVAPPEQTERFMPESETTDNASKTPTTPTPPVNGTTAPKQPRKKDLTFYTAILFLVCQVGYFPMAGTLLFPTYFTPSKADCAIMKNSTYIVTGVVEEGLGPWYTSGLVEWGKACTAEGATLKTIISSVSMAGAATGSFLSGPLADRWGRKLATVMATGVVVVGNFAQIGATPLGIVATAIVTFLTSIGGGAYMVTNMVLLVEALDQPRSRLLVVCLNGWTLGMSFCSILTYLTRHYRYFHAANAITAIITGTLIQLLTRESTRWLISINRYENAVKVKDSIDRMNEWFNNLAPSFLKINDIEEIYGLPPPPTKAPEAQGAPKAKEKHHSYVDLVRYRSVLIPLLALCYCYLTSSLVSFGFYFGLDLLPGNMFRNMALMGMFKFIFGFLPYPVSFCVGRKPIMAVSTGCAALFAWAYICLKKFSSPGQTFMAILGLLITSMMDPTWKMNHLFSAELFPTVVRNMARAVCNCVSRLGSLAAPTIVSGASASPLIPIMIFSVMLTIQLAVELIFFPETANRPLPEVIPEEQEAKSSSSAEEGKSAGDGAAGTAPAAAPAPETASAPAPEAAPAPAPAAPAGSEGQQEETK